MRPRFADVGCSAGAASCRMIHVDPS
jgi:hypothetical protein